MRIEVGLDVTGFESASRVTEDHRAVMKNYASPLLSGPPPSEDLLEMIVHMFTEEEAAIVRHLPPLRPRTAEKVAIKAGVTPADARRVLDHLAFTKHLILAAGSPRKYSILPVVPGTFEMALMTPDISTRNAWHKKFAQLFERVFETGFLKDYPGSKALVRYLPVQAVSNTLQKAWPSDYLEEILDRYDFFAVGNCQCRLAMHYNDRGCDKPLFACSSFGPMAKPVVARGLFKEVSKAELIAIKKDAEEHGCVSWMMNAAGDPRGDGSCSCCGCCCHALRMVSEFSVPGLIATPHFMPDRDDALCNECGLCVKRCPMSAWFKVEKKVRFNATRCIGCGLCVTACKQKALTLHPVDEARKPESSYLSLLTKMLPGFTKNSVAVFAKRLFQR
ncbi:MAG: 4Fe-4S binding protein [Thermodesulfobacteriota bacterium]